MGLAIVLLIFLGIAGFKAYRVWHALDSSTGINVPYARGAVYPTAVPVDNSHRINILVLGSDNDKKKEESRPLSQSMILVTIDPLHNQVSLLSIPRDFWVPISGHGMGKIDLAYKYGGVALARQTVHDLFHVKIDYYAWVGLEGFIQAIDTFQGVSLDVSHPILDDNYPDDLNSANPYGYKRVFITAGWQHMDGSQALEYVRSRHGDLIGDFGRSNRQQQVLLQFKQKLSIESVLLNLDTLSQVLSSSIRTDLTRTQLLSLQELSHRIRKQDVKQVVLAAPFYSRYDTRQGQSVVIPDWAKIRPLVSSMFAPLATPTPVPSTSTVAPTGTPAATGTAVKGRAPVRTDVPVPVPVATATPPSLNTLPGRLLYVSRGNLFEARRDLTVNQMTSVGNVAMPAVSPDGRTIALIHFRNFSSDLWLLDLRSKHLRALTYSIDPHEVRNNLWAAWPSWTADGQHILFSYDRGKLASPVGDIRLSDLSIWSQPANGGSAIQLSQSKSGAGGDTDVTSRPHSTQYAYIGWDYNRSNNTPFSQLVMRDTSGGQASYLTPMGGRVLQPQWDVPGRRLTFVRLTNGVDQIVVAPLVGGPSGLALGKRTVIASGQVAQPAFSPDGKVVSYLRAEGDGFALYVAPAAGGLARRVDALGTQIDARWRPVWIR